jgi:dynein heavy chain 2
MLTQMAMGSGQTDGAMEELLVSAKEGKWLCLKNLHLVTSWLPRLEKALKGLNAHENFRLWLTTEGHPKFPNILLQQSLKVTYESPPGIKQNLLRTYESWDPAYISKGGVTRAQTLFCLAWFHAIVQERRTYIPQGFTKFYEFSFADLRSGADVIDNIYKGINPSGKADVDPKKLPWETIWGLMQFAIYGGRIDNDHDVRVLNSYLGRYFSTAMLGTSPKRQLNNGLELPVTADHKDYKDLILSMPDTDAPSLFCLPANIEGAVQRKQGNFVESQLRKLAVSSATSTKFNRELWRVSLAPILQLWEKLSSNGKVLDAPPRLSKPAAELQPVDSFVVLEMQKIHRLVTLVHTAITNLNNLVNGVGLLTPETNGDANELLSGDTPWRWARNWYGPEEASNWVKELVMRKLAMLDWLRRVDSGSLLQSPLSLAQLFQPSVFLNALRQQTARATRQPIDSLRLTASWEPSLLSKASVKVTVEGMLLQGCLFEGSKLSALRPDSALFAPLPNVTLAYVGDDYPEPYGAKSLGVPIYFAASREEFIAEVKMPCDGDKEDWILAGAAILLSDMK